MIRIKQMSQAFTHTMTLISGIAFILISNSVFASKSDKTSVLTANTQFYSALNKMFMGDLAPMKKAWSHANDVIYMGPDGKYLHGWGAVLKNWESQAAMKLGGRVEPFEVHVLVGKDLAVVNDYEKGENTDKGRVERVKIRATNVFRKENGQWKMVSHHTDLLPYLAK